MIKNKIHARPAIEGLFNKPESLVFWFFGLLPKAEGLSRARLRAAAYAASQGRGCARPAIEGLFNKPESLVFWFFGLLPKAEGLSRARLRAAAYAASQGRGCARPAIEGQII